MGIVTEHAASPVDPLSGLVVPTVTGTNCPAGAPGVGTSLTPGCYTSIADTVTTLASGIYKITGDFNINHPHVTANNVLLYLTGAGHLIATPPGGTKWLTVTAQTSGPYQGVAIWQDVSDNNNFDTNNNFKLEFSGAIYMPGTPVHFNNAITFVASACSLFIAQSLQIDNGNGDLHNTGCSGLYGGAAFLSISVAE